MVFHAQKTLTSLQAKIVEYWQTKTKDENADETKASLDEIDKWIKELKPSLVDFADGSEYVKISPNLTEELKHCLRYWDDMNKLTAAPEPVDEFLTAQLQNIVDALKTVRKETEALWRLRMHEVNKSSLKQGLETYPMQSQLTEMSKDITPKQLDDMTYDQLCQTVRDFVKKAKVKLKYDEHLEMILKEDSLKCLELKNVIKINILEPFRFTTDSEKIDVIASADKIALSEVLKKVEGLLESKKEFWIRLNSTTNATFYFDSDLTADHFKGKIIYISASFIEIIRNCNVNLHISKYSSGTLTVRGRLIGENNIKDNELVLSKKDETDEMRNLRFQWPLKMT